MQKPKTNYVPSPHQNSRPSVNKPAPLLPDAIVLHHTASGGDAASVARWFADPKSQVSAHYIVDKTGAIVQCVADDRRAWHAGESVLAGRKDVNSFSIGIELVNKGDGQDPYTDQQYWALAELVTYLQKKYRIPLSRVVGHRDICVPRGRKTDPSDNFDWPRLRRMLSSRGNARPPVPGKPPGKPPTPAA